MSNPEMTDADAAKTLIEALMKTTDAVLNRLAHLETAMKSQAEMLSKLSEVTRLHNEWFAQLAGAPAPAQKAGLN